MFRLIWLIVKIAIVIAVLGYVHRFIAKRYDLGSLGFRPAQHQCFGILMKSEDVYEAYNDLPFLPKGKVKTKFFNLEYDVPQDTQITKGKEFCFGQDKARKNN